MVGEIHSSVASVMSPGMALAAARKAQGLTVENVAGRLRLSPLQIAAIEANDFAALPGDVFARGFVRNYARLLNLNEQPLLSAMAQHQPRDSRLPDERLLRDVKGIEMNPQRFRGLPVAAVAIAAVVGALAFYEFILSDTQSAKSLVTMSSPPVRVTTPSEKIAPPVTESAAPADGQGAVQNPPRIVAANSGLHFLFSRESWVEVRDGLGNILFSKTNFPGTEHHVQGEPPFNIIIGSAHGVQLAYNGTPVDLAAYATEDVARLRLK